MYPKTAILFLLAMLLAACSSPPPLPDTAPTVRPTVTNQPEATPKLSGPETTPIISRPYPAILTVETANAGIAGVVDAPPSITGLADVQAIMTKHAQLARDVGLSFDHMAVKYVASEQRWFLVPVASDGTTIAGWLEIADPTSQSGWRFAEQPTWDSQYHPSTDTYQYGLPALHDPANHFETGFANGFPILIEVTASATPQYWNNIVQKTTLLVEGAVLPTETPVLSQNPSAQELFAAQQGDIPQRFEFGGHEWTAGTNDKGEKVWIREDGKITFEWASLYGGGRYNAYMFVTRSERVEGKRSVEIYADPRSYIFFHIEGSPDAIDDFLGNSVANAMKSDAAQAVLKQPGSTLKIIVGGMEHWPIGPTGLQDIYFYGPNGETLSQKIWGLQEVGDIGPFVEPAGNAVQCGKFQSSEGRDGYLKLLNEHPEKLPQQAAKYMSHAITNCVYLDPESSTTGSIPNYNGNLLFSLFASELIDVK